jgi:RNA polymerase sigma-70 factor (ECF subfamily)
MATSTVDDDIASVGAALRGDPTGFAALYRRHVGAVRMAIRDNVHDAEGVADAVQDTFAKAFARLEALREPERFRPWLLQIARNTAIDHRRVRRRVEYDDFAETEDLADGGLGPDGHVELNDLASLVNGCVAALSPRDATAITMTTKLGLGPSEIGAALGVSTGAAKVLLHRARHRLREALVLELSLRAQQTPCETFAALRQAEPTKAGAHVRGCEVCQGAAEQELTFYDMPTARSAGSDQRP